MTKPREFPVGLRVLLPLLAAGALLLTPRAGTLDAAFQGARLASELNLPKAAAVQRVDLAQWEPWRLELWQQAGQLALSGGEPELAIRSMEQARRLGGLDDAGRLSLGEAYWVSQNPGAALAVWEPLLDSGRAPQEIYQRVVQYQRDQGEWQGAARSAQDWWRAYPGSGLAAWIFGGLGLAQDLEPAGLALQLAGSLDLKRAAASRVLLNALQQLAQNAPGEYRAVQLGRALGNVGEWELAQTAFDRAKTLNPNYAEAWAFSSEAKQQLNQNGLPELERGLALGPDSAALQAMAGLYYRRKGDAQQALQHFLAAAELEPRRGIWQVEIGSSYADLHNTQKGLEYYGKAATLEPQNPAMWQLVAQYCLNHDLAVRETALPAARQAAALAPDNPASVDLLGLVMLALGDDASAERFLQQSLAMNAEFPAAYLHLGQLYLRQGRLNWAEYALARAAQLPEKDAESALLAQRLLARYFYKP